MRTAVFTLRNTKEIVRDKLNMAFGVGFPILLLLLLTMIQSNVPVEVFSIEKLAPGIAVFGFSFLSLFSGLVIAKDRTSAFIIRLFTSPMRPADFIIGYTVPLIPLALMQSAVCFGFAMALGLTFSVNIFVAILAIVPAAIMYIAIGLLCGSLFNDKQVGGVCGALLTNLSAWLSGTWFDIGLAGSVFKKIADILPFSHAVNAGRYTLSGEYGNMFSDLVWVIGYAAVILIGAILVFTHKMHHDM